MPFVLDASVALSWCFPDEESTYADSVLGGFASDSALVPDVWPFEVANGLLIAQRRRRITDHDVGVARGILLDLPIEVAHQTLDEALGAVLELARAQRLSSYDATYLALAMRHGLPLATLDVGLRAAAADLGVPIVG